MAGGSALRLQGRMEAPERARSMAARAARPTSFLSCHQATPTATGTARVTCSIRSSCKRCCCISASTARRQLKRSRAISRPCTSKYLRCWCLCEMQIEHTNRIKQMTDEEIEQAIEAIQTMLAARAGEAAKVIEGSVEPAALPAP